jgi:hypothetical protein
MTANELADLLETTEWTNNKAAAMLRQLQAENDALRKTVDSLFAGLDSSLALNKAQAERNNEPVAWMNIHKQFNKKETWLFPIPLYTHPVKELDEQFKKGFEAGKEEGWKAHKFHHPVKELTDEEIEEVLTEIAMNNENVYSFDSYDVFESMEFSRVGIFAFARAILRKVQENG